MLQSKPKNIFDKLDEYEIRIKDGNTPRALISKTKDDKRTTSSYLS